MLFDELSLWVDGHPRSGPGNMAVDEWLLETSEVPVLRAYQWAGDWASLGYFGKIGEARALFPGVGLVRRWTGGGMVDHRGDWTYTLVAPCGTSLAGMKGDASYRAIHSALAVVLESVGIFSRLAQGGGGTATLCFENPVNHDLVGPEGEKIAGAGQRRTKRGLLHQGSVDLGSRLADSDPAVLVTALGRSISRTIRPFDPGPDPADLALDRVWRYESEPWLERR